ncbi:PREDICTED: X-ray repair cross-complementing protein 5-like isoform X1 [Trachymyrmex cornetzi]|uniref:X-ray repair cross-complementing protein 5-like isoform X1 n=1 Tax=Trachymyrmex cornetzi TaxID=471704 RepID=UPI00084F7E76|nr:PREDICTED: X-ray repair cross-complementing protein 5-like isoform X1 [Trachymyrmex cornetzi]XP_018373622.1 PREDICTED: X-ray repair cross-complementing protein 5-like isoform X1 [Trachymyrmex cornetzi]
MPPKLKESITFVINVGIVQPGTQSNLQLLDKEKYILKHIIQKKIFLRPKDEIGVILMGSNSSTSDSITGLDNAQELCNMQTGNWDLIKNIEKLQSTNQICSWMDAIYAAVEYIKHECVDKCERKIILLSSFNEEENVDVYQAEDIIEILNSEAVSLIAIGERVLHDTDEDFQTPSEALLMKVLQQINGQYLTFEHAMSDVRFYKRPSTKPFPWRCLMELGELCIPITGISKMPSEVKLPEMVLMGKTSTSNTPDKEVPIKNVAQWMDNNRTIHTEEDIIRGYVYGGKAIPVSDEAKKAMTPKNNEKSYKIHGFTMRENVPMEYWLSDGSYVIVPANETASAPFYSLVQAMVEKNVVAIVEKVYRANTEANMVALFPSVDVENEPWCLIEIGLPFERDYGAIAQKPLKGVMNQLSQEQDNAMDDLLRSLELPDAADDDTISSSEKYLPGYMPDPGTQHMWDVLTARALNPDKPLPPIADDLLNLLEQPEFIKAKCKPVTERIKNLFFLEKKKPLRKRKIQEDDNKQSDANDDAPMTQALKEEQRDTGNNDVDDISDLCSFDFDDIADI